MRKKESVFTVPPVAKEIINKIVEKRQKEEREKTNNLATELMAQRKRLYEEAKIAKKYGLPLAKKIFAWIDFFHRTEEGYKLISLGTKYNYRQGIFFFDKQVDGQPWRGLGVSKKGLWWIRNGCGAHENYVSTPEELALQVNHKILESAWQTIESEEVWDCIKKRMSD